MTPSIPYMITSIILTPLSSWKSLHTCEQPGCCYLFDFYFSLGSQTCAQVSARVWQVQKCSPSLWYHSRWSLAVHICASFELSYNGVWHDEIVHILVTSLTMWSTMKWLNLTPMANWHVIQCLSTSSSFTSWTCSFGMVVQPPHNTQDHSNYNELFHHHAAVQFGSVTWYQKHTQINSLLQLLCTYPSTTNHTMKLLWPFYNILEMIKGLHDCCMQHWTPWWWAIEPQTT